jgi:hypothetical protein
MYACDWDWWAEHYKAVEKGFKGKRYTHSTETHQHANPDAGFNLNRIPGKSLPGLGKDCIHYGKNGGYQAVNLAYLLGAKTIILLGFDMMATGHWFGDHKGRLNRPSPYHDFIAAFKTINPDDYGLEIINCTRETALTCFPVVPLEKVFG